MTPCPRVSVVVNTYQRAAALADTLDGLRRLDGPEVEVVVVNGPSTDSTEALLQREAGRIKVGTCPQRNLSISRNVGIALAAGDIVAFIDDDAVPEPDWVEALVSGYEDDEVAAVGGPVLDHTGVVWQVRQLRSNRYGDTVVDRPGDLDAGRALSVPGAAWFPSLLGASSSFRRDRLVALGGFDEQYDYFLDETDVCVRLVDAGWVVRQVDWGAVHHRYLPSSIRTADRVVRNRYPVFKNAAYFALRHGLATQSFAEVAAGYTALVERHRRWLSDEVAAGHAAPADLDAFEDEVRAGSSRGYADALAPVKTRPPEAFASPPPFLPLPLLRPPGRRLHVAFVTREHPPGPVNGIGRLYHAQARALAARGHVVRVVTASPDHERVDFEDGVWVHRAVTDAADPAPVGVPPALWAWSATARHRLLGAHARRSLDVVEVPSWDGEGVAVLGALDCPVALGLYTPLTTLARVDPRVAALPAAELAELLALERRCLEAAPLVLASGPWTIDEVEAGHGLRIDPSRVRFAPHGLPDVTAGVEPERWGDRGPGLLFVGRLEPRKGIDVLLTALPRLFTAVPGLSVTVAGDDPSGHRERFALTAPADVTARTRFLGRVDDRRLRALYAGADVFVAPSRYESFGLVLLEAMMFGVTVVASATGGMAEIVEDGESGLLVPPGDSEALAAALERVLTDPLFRRRLGDAGRHRYRTVYDEEAMAARLEAALTPAPDAAQGRASTRLP